MEGLLDPYLLVDGVQSKQVRVSQSIQWQNSMGYRKTWQEYLDLYEFGKKVSGFNVQGMNIEEPCHDPTINLVWSTVNTAYSSVLPTNAKFTVNAVNPEDALNAVILQQVMNSDWVGGGAGDSVSMAIKDSLIFGHGIVRVDYKQLSVNKVRGYDPANGKHVSGMVSDLASQGRRGFGFSNYPDSKKLAQSLGNKEFQVAVLDEGARLKYVSPFDFFVDHYATSWDECRWVAQRYYVPIEEARSNKAWNKQARDTLMSTVAGMQMDNSQVLSRVMNHGFGDSGLVELYEFYDLLEGTYCVFSQSCDKYLLDPTPTIGYFGHPFVVLDNEKIPSKLYPVGEVAQIKSLQLELNDTRADRMNRRQSFRPRWLYKPDAFGEDALNNLASDDPMPLMVAVEGDEPITSVIRPMDPGHIPDTTYVDDGNVRRDIYEVSGLSDFQRGVSSNVNTATEASLISAGDHSRVSRKITNVEGFITKIGQKMAVLIQQYTSVPRALRVTGVSGLNADALNNTAEMIGDTLYFSAGRESMSGPMDVEIAVGSVSPRNGAVKQKEVSTLLAMLMPFVSLGVVDPQKLVTYMLTTGWDIHNPESFLKGISDALGSTPAQVGPDGAPIPPAQATGPQGGPPGIRPPAGGSAAMGAGDQSIRNQAL